MKACKLMINGLLIGTVASNWLWKFASLQYLCEVYQVSFLFLPPSVVSHIHLIYIQEIDSSPLWQQLSACCPDLLFARGMVAICWRRLIFFSPSLFFREICLCVCVCTFFCIHNCTHVHASCFHFLIDLN